MALTENDVAAELQRKLDVWFYWGVVWEWIHWIVGVAGIAASAMGSGIGPDENGRIFAVVATICFGILGFANPQKRSSRYLQAYRAVDTILREFRCGIVQLPALLQEHRRAEQLLNDGEVRDPEPAKNAPG